MIHTALIYFLLDHCLDRLDSKISSTMSMAMSVMRRDSSLTSLDMCGLVWGCNLLWLNYIDGKGKLNRCSDCRVLSMDRTRNEILLR